MAEKNSTQQARKVKQTGSKETIPVGPADGMQDSQLLEENSRLIARVAQLETELAQSQCTTPALESLDPQLIAVEAEKHHADFATRVHVYINETVRYADTKAALIMTACGIPFSLALSQTDKFGLAFSLARQNSMALLGVNVILASALVVTLGWTIYQCIQCIFPRLQFSGGTLISFPDIAQKMLAEDEALQTMQNPDGPDKKPLTEAEFEATCARVSAVYASRVRALTPTGCVDQLSAHNFTLSCIASVKHGFVSKAIWGLKVIFLLALLLAVTFTITFAEQTPKTKEGGVAASTDVPGTPSVRNAPPANSVPSANNVPSANEAKSSSMPLIHEKTIPTLRPQ